MERTMWLFTIKIPSFRCQLFAEHKVFFQIDTGIYKPEPQVAEQPATSEDVVTSKEGSREKNNCTHSHRTRHRSYQSTRERLVLPALPVRTPTLTPESPHSPTPGVTRDVTSSVTRSVTTAQFESETEVDGVHFRAASAPRVSVVQTAHSPRVSVVQTAHSPVSYSLSDRDKAYHSNHITQDISLIRYI